MSGRRAKAQRRLARAQQPPPQVKRAAPVGLPLPQRYGLLHYPGNVTSSDALQPGRLLGSDETGRPYEVIDAECAGGRTTVQLQYATTENVLATLAAAGIAS